MYNFFYRSNIMSRKLYIEDIVTNTPNVIPKTISIVQVTAANANISTINTNYANVNTIESLSITATNAAIHNDINVSRNAIINKTITHTIKCFTVSNGSNDAKSNLFSQNLISVYSS